MPEDDRVIIIIIIIIIIIMLSAGTLISFKDKMSPLNIFYYKLIFYVLSIYLIALCT
jgi:hypothetical protein